VSFDRKVFSEFLQTPAAKSENCILFAGAVPSGRLIAYFKLTGNKIAQDLSLALIEDAAGRDA
jgi:hypothetical protein